MAVRLVLRHSLHLGFVEERREDLVSGEASFIILYIAQKRDLSLSFIFSNQSFFLSLSLSVSFENGARRWFDALSCHRRKRESFIALLFFFRSTLHSAGSRKNRTNARAMCVVFDRRERERRTFLNETSRARARDRICTLYSDAWKISLR